MNQSRKDKKRRKYSASPISELVGKMMAPIVVRRAGMTLDLMVAWPELIGGPLGAASRPEKIVWPRKANEDDPFQPATLIVACNGAQALFLQHETTQIIEKVNGFFGFDAIRSIRIQQKPVEMPKSVRKSNAKRPTAKDRSHVNSIVKDVSDDKLRERLRRLGEGVLAKNGRKNDPV